MLGREAASEGGGETRQTSNEGGKETRKIRSQNSHSLNLNA